MTQVDTTPLACVDGRRDPVECASIQRASGARFPAEYTIEVREMRSITTLDLQYAHRFYGFRGEAQYLHGHTGVLTIEVEDSVEPGVNMVFP